jgi:hypothetical protein
MILIMTAQERIPSFLRMRTADVAAPKGRPQLLTYPALPIPEMVLGRTAQVAPVYRCGAADI